MKTLREFKDDLSEAAAKTPHQQMLKTLGFPNVKSRYGGGHGEHKSSWSKSGGHAGAKTVDRIVEKAKTLGFTAAKDTSGHNADGSYVNSGTHYVHPEGHHLTVNKSYGPTKDYNDFSMRLSHTPK